MPRPKTTVVPPTFDAVLLIGASDELDCAARYAAAAVHHSIGVRRCDFLSAVREAVEIRPMAIVISAAAYAFDPVELSALAKDVGARLVLVDGDSLDLDEARALMRAELEEVFTARHRGASAP